MRPAYLKPFNPQILRRFARAALPGVRIQSIRTIEHGHDNVALDVNRRQIIRIPRRRRSAGSLVREAALL
jgi:hypothetical protein